MIPGFYAVRLPLARSSVMELPSTAVVVLTSALSKVTRDRLTNRQEAIRITATVSSRLV